MWLYVQSIPTLLRPFNNKNTNTVTRGKNYRPGEEKQMKIIPAFGLDYRQEILVSIIYVIKRVDYTMTCSNGNKVKWASFSPLMYKWAQTFFSYFQQT